MRKNIGAMMGIFGAMAAMGGMDYDTSRYHTNDEPKEPVIPPIPKGCKEYFFNEYDKFSNDIAWKAKCVFSCIAINDKNAEKKFNKWKNEKT